MYRLIYVSTARSDLTDRDIASILDASQSNNHERYLTGFLAHNGQNFMQALEGEEAEVKEIFDRIRRDNRHSCVVQIVGEEITERAFPDWSMNYFRADEPSRRAMVVRRDDPVDSLMPATTPRELLHMFTQFMTVKEPAA